MKISVIIPVRNEESSLSRLIDSLRGQTRLPDEVIFIDAGSTDRTREIASRCGQNGEMFRTLSIGVAYPGVARNVGVKESKYDTVAFTDGGIELDRDWLKELSVAMDNDPSVEVVYGSYSPRTDSIFKQCLAIAVVPPTEKRTSFIASSLLKKTVWQDVGGFPDFRAAEDRIFMNRIKERGFNIRYNPNAFVVWDIPSDIVKVFRRFYSYSFHDLRAGVAKDWHIPVATMYLAGSILLILGIVFSPLFFVLLAVVFLVRVAKKLFINRKEPYFINLMAPCYLILGSIIMLVIDLAMFAGSVKYAVEGLKK